MNESRYSELDAVKKEYRRVEKAFLKADHEDFRSYAANFSEHPGNSEGRNLQVRAVLNGKTALDENRQIEILTTATNDLRDLMQLVCNAYYPHQPEMKQILGV